MYMHLKHKLYILSDVEQIEKEEKMSTKRKIRSNSESGHSENKKIAIETETESQSVIKKEPVCFDEKISDLNEIKETSETKKNTKYASLR